MLYIIFSIILLNTSPSTGCKSVYRQYQKELGLIKQLNLESKYSSAKIHLSTLSDLELFHSTCFSTPIGIKLKKRKQFYFSAQKQYRTVHTSFDHVGTSKRGRLLATIGWIIFGGGYLGSGLTGTLSILPTSNRYYGYIALNLIPVVGPFLLANLFWGKFQIPPTGYAIEFLPNLAIGIVGFFNFVLGVSQVVGLILAIVGHSIQLDGYLKFKSSSGVIMSIQPWATDNSTGISVQGTF